MSANFLCLPNDRWGRALPFASRPKARGSAGPGGCESASRRWRLSRLPYHRSIRPPPPTAAGRPPAPPADPAHRPPAAAAGCRLPKASTLPVTITIPAAAARAIPSAANRVLPTPPSPTTRTMRALSPSAPSSRDNSTSRPTKPPAPSCDRPTSAHLQGQSPAPRTRPDPSPAMTSAAAVAGGPPAGVLPAALKIAAGNLNTPGRHSWAIARSSPTGRSRIPEIAPATSPERNSPECAPRLSLTLTNAVCDRGRRARICVPLRNWLPSSGLRLAGPRPLGRRPLPP
jgi:hypothetical protein